MKQEQRMQMMHRRIEKEVCVFLRSCSKSDSFKHSTILANILKKEMTVLTFFSLVSLVDQGTLRTTVLISVGSFRFCVI